VHDHGQRPVGRAQDAVQAGAVVRAGREPDPAVPPGDGVQGVRVRPPQVQRADLRGRRRHVADRSAGVEQRRCLGPHPP
jgi:hypothetical protein